VNLEPGRASAVRLGVAAFVGYLAGSLPVADRVARASGADSDLRDVGSGNPGALNAAESLGARWGVVVLVGDVAKGYVATQIGRAVAGPTGANIAGSAAVIGHCYPVWTNFSGGKGVATSVGQVLGTFPVYFPIDFGVAAATAALPGWRQRSFAATLAASMAWTGVATVWWRRGWRNPLGPRPVLAMPVAAAVSSALIAKRFLDESRAGR
jgi:glycerol-3-phosphate acyltransferase PlsY